MNVRASGTKLAAATTELSNRWQQTKDYWKDAKAQEFEQQYMQELFGSVTKAVTVIEQLDKLVNKIRSDCE